MNRDYIVGDVVLQRIINNEQKMVVERVSKDAVKCRWFGNENEWLYDEWFSKSNIILLSDYKEWNLKQLRTEKMNILL